jgi:hypothetical protein
MALEEGPWARYEPTANDLWDPRRVAHLHRRAGFGATWAELQRDLQAGPVASVDRLLNQGRETARASWPHDDQEQILWRKMRTSARLPAL